jgi:hypothetical protein
MRIYCSARPTVTDVTVGSAPLFVPLSSCMATAPEHVHLPLTVELSAVLSQAAPSTPASLPFVDKTPVPERVPPPAPPSGSRGTVPERAPTAVSEDLRLIQGVMSSQPVTLGDNHRCRPDCRRSALKGAYAHAIRI